MSDRVVLQKILRVLGLACTILLLVGGTHTSVSGDALRKDEMQMPDLTLKPEDISFSDDTPVANQTITVWARVHNVGNTLAYNVPVYFYNNTTVIGVSVLSLVEPDIPRSTYTIWTPQDAGVVNITVFIDPLNIINESDEDNNIAWRDIKVLEPLFPDLQVVDITFSNDKPKDGETVTIHASIFNSGRMSAKDIIVAFLDNNTVFSYEILSFIGPNQTATATVLWVAKSNTGDTTTPRVIMVFVDPEDKINEVSEANNIMTRVIFVGRPVLPELSILPEDIYLSTTHPLSNETITLYARVRNIGDIRADNVPVAFYVGSQLIGIHVLDSISGGLSSTASVQWTPSAGFATLSVVIDPEAKIKEYDKTNNIANKTIIIDKYLPQISLTNFSCSSSRVIENMTVTLYADVANTGHDAAFNLVVRVYDIFEGSMKEIGWSYLDKISPGMKRIAFVRWVAAPPGNHTIHVEVDPEYSTGELNATHAELNATIYVIPSLPDLEAISIAIHPVPEVEGVLVRVNATIRNYGIIEARDVTVVLIDNECVVAIRVITIPADPTGNTKINITFNYTSVPGIHVLTIFLDPQNMIPEYNENDNSISLELKVREKPVNINLAMISLIVIILVLFILLGITWHEKIQDLMLTGASWVVVFILNTPFLRGIADKVYAKVKGKSSRR